MDELLDASDVAELLGLTNPKGVSVYQRRYEDFPAPVISRGRCRLWTRKEIASWVRKRGDSRSSGTDRYGHAARVSRR